MLAFGLFGDIFSKNTAEETQKFFTDTAKIKEIAREQMIVDNAFRKEILALKKTLFMKKITPLEFWEQYKKAMNQSIGKNKKNFDELLKNVDKEMKEKLKEAGQNSGPSFPEEKQLGMDLQT